MTSDFRSTFSHEGGDYTRKSKAWPQDQIVIVRIALQSCLNCLAVSSNYFAMDRQAAVSDLPIRPVIHFQIALSSVLVL